MSDRRAYVFKDSKGRERSIVPENWTFYTFGQLGIVLDVSGQLVDVVNVTAYQAEPAKPPKPKRPRTWTEAQRKEMSRITLARAKKDREERWVMWPTKT